MSTRTTSTPWWQNTDEPMKVHDRLFAQYEAIENNHSDVVSDMRRYSALYSNRPPPEQINSSYLRLFAEARSAPITFNLVAAMVDTVTSKHAATQPRITVQTEQGDWDLWKRALGMEKAIAGIFYQSELYRRFPAVFRDAALFGTGYLKWYTRGGKINCERIFPNEIRIDRAEAQYGSPRQMYHCRWVSKSVLQAMFPDYTDEIDKASSTRPPPMGVSVSAGDMVEVVEGWHLPSGPKAKDGKHVIGVQGAALHMKDWKHDTFPIVPFRWRSGLQDFYGEGLGSQLLGLQMELNALLKKIQMSFRMMAVPYYLVEAGSKIVADHLNNQIGHIVTYVGTKPEARINQTVHPEVFGHLERIYRTAFEIAGVNPMEALARNPNRLESSLAINQMTDIASERHYTVQLEMDYFFKDCARQALRCAKESGRNFSVLGPYRNKMLRVEWKEVDLEEESFAWKLEPANLLPTTPAGKIAIIEKLANAGVLKPNEALRLLQHPDIEHLIAKNTASEEDIDYTIYMMTVKEQPMTPEPFQDLAGAVKAVQAAYLRARMNGAPSKVLNLLIDYMVEANELLNPEPQEPQGMVVSPIDPTMQQTIPGVPAGVLPLQPSAAMINATAA